MKQGLIHCSPFLVSIFWCLYFILLSFVMIVKLILFLLMRDLPVISSRSSQWSSFFYCSLHSLLVTSSTVWILDPTFIKRIPRGNWLNWETNYYSLEVRYSSAALVQYILGERLVRRHIVKIESFSNIIKVSPIISLPQNKFFIFSMHLFAFWLWGGG